MSTISRILVTVFLKAVINKSLAREVDLSMKNREKSKGLAAFSSDPPSPYIEEGVKVTVKR